MTGSVTAVVRSVESHDGLVIAYTLTTPAKMVADRPALLLIHGWGQSSRSWGAGLIETFAADRPVIAMDMRGHGATHTPPIVADDPGAHYTAVDFAADVAAVLDSIGDVAAAGVVILGWSYGGLVTCDYLASDRAHQVRGVGLIGAITSMGRGAKGGQVGESMRAALPGAYSTDPRTAIRALGSFGSALVPRGRDDLGVIAQQFFGASLSSAPHARQGLFSREAHYDEMLKALDLPALIIHGTADTVVDVSASEHAAGLLRNATPHYWDGAGHAPFVEDAALFIDQVNDFLTHIGSLGRSDASA